MHIALFCHSLLSDWNNGNAHFLRGVVTELQHRGHDVRAFEPVGSWSATNLVADHGWPTLAAVRQVYPQLPVRLYEASTLDLDEALDGCSLVIVHEWNSPDIVRRVGEHRRTNKYLLLFHDTHHRSFSDDEAIASFALESYDGVLAFGEAIRERYLLAGWTSRAWTWHEAADTRVFAPAVAEERQDDLVWIGNWGDGERSDDIREFLIEPAKQLGLRTTVHGVRYPAAALDELAASGIAYRGWLANFDVPRAFAAHRATVHVPRRPYVDALPGIPTIRTFEALASGIPLVCAPWHDTEGLFTPGADYLVARNGSEMRAHLHDVLEDVELARALVNHGLATIRARHTCAHRVDELLTIYRSMAGESRWNLIAASEPEATQTAVSG